MSFFGAKKKFTVTEEDPTYKVRYLGNVQTALMKGDGCVDKPTGVLWNNYLKNSSAGLEMKLTVCASGLKALTREQGLTEYRAHRISYCIAHPNYPKLFIWVYRHEGKKMKVELRCHAVLCKSEHKAKALAVHLHEKLAMALSEFMREKNRRQTSRLALQKAGSIPAGASGEKILARTSNTTTSSSGVAGVLTRKKFLNTSQNFKPPVERSPGAPKLVAISEDFEEEEEEEEETEVEEGQSDSAEEDGRQSPVSATSASSTPSRYQRPADGRIPLQPSASDPDLRNSTCSQGQSDDISDLTNSVFDLEIGNDIEALKADDAVQFQLLHPSDDSDESSESGFSEQDAKETLSASIASVSSSVKTSDPGNSPTSSSCLSQVSYNSKVVVPCDCNSMTEHEHVTESCDIESHDPVVANGAVGL